MGNDLKKDKTAFQSERRIFFKRKNVLRFAYPLMVLFGFVVVISVIAPAFAIETTKASALNLEEMREDYTLSYTRKSPQSSQVDSCLSYLNAHLSPDAKHKDFADQSKYRRPAGNKAVPVALGLVLGVRIALGPRELVNPTQRVQIGPELRSISSGSNPRALAIAAYRGCKNDQTLKLQKRNKKKKHSF